MAELRLRPLRDEDEGQAIAAHEELAPDDFAFLLDWDPWRPWREHVTMQQTGVAGAACPSTVCPRRSLLPTSAASL